MMTFEQTLERWIQVKQAVSELQEEERMLREGIFNGCFPAPVEGVNKYSLPNGTVIKGTYTLNRKLLVNPLEDNRWASLKLPGHIAGPLLNRKWDLAIKPYRELVEEHRKLVDSVLEIKPGLPKLEVV